MIIRGGMYGKDSKNITLDKLTYEEHCGRKAYYTAFSKYGIAKNEITETFVCPDEKLARIITHNAGRIVVKTDENNYSMIV